MYTFLRESEQILLTRLLSATIYARVLPNRLGFLPRHSRTRLAFYRFPLQQVLLRRVVTSFRGRSLFVVMAIKPLGSAVKLGLYSSLRKHLEGFIVRTRTSCFFQAGKGRLLAQVATLAETYRLCLKPKIVGKVVW